MNAIAAPQPRARGMLARAWNLFWHGTGPLARWSALSCFAPFAAIDLWRGQMPSLYIFAMFLWWLWVPQIAVMQRDARLERLPGLGKDVPAALLLALIPLAVAFALSGDPLTLGRFVALCALGTSVMLSALSNLRWAMFALVVTVFTDKLSGKFFGVEFLTTALKAISATIASSPLLAVAALVAVVAFAAWRWRGFVRLAEIPPTAAMDAPLALMGRLKNPDQDPLDSLMTGLSFGLLAGVFRTRPASVRATPLAAMRTLCGPLFVPLSKPQYVMRLLMGVVALVFMMIMIASDLSLAGGMIAGMISLAMSVVLMPYLVRLWQLMSTPSGDLAELATLPGWNDGENAKRMLLDALWRTIRPEFLSMLLLLAPLPFVHWYAGRMSLAMALAYLPAIGTLQLSLACAAVALLVGKRSGALARLGAYPAAAMFVALNVLFFSGPANPFWQGVLTGLISASVILCVLFAVALVLTLCRYRAQSHPFLCR